MNSMFNERPIRAYSVGSRLEHNKRKMRVDMLSSEHGHNSTSRVRAFSVGSRAKVARSDVYNGLANPAHLLKANSQDIVNLISTINNNNKTNNMSNSAKLNQCALNSNNNINNNHINNTNFINNNNSNNNINNNNNNNMRNATIDGKKSASTTFLANAQQRSRVN